MSLAVFSPCDVASKLLSEVVGEKYPKVDDDDSIVEPVTSLCLPQLSYEDFHHFSVIPLWNKTFPCRLATEWNPKNKKDAPPKKKNALVILERVASRSNQNAVSRVINILRSKVHLMFSSSNELPSSEDVERWKKSPETLAASEYGCNLFIQFLKEQTSENEVDFWLDCQKFRSSKMSSRQNEARRIFDEYFAMGSPKKIYIERYLWCVVQAYLVNDPGWRHTFDVAQAYVGLKLAKKSHKKFLEDPLYLDLVELVTSGVNYNKFWHDKSE